MLRVAELAIILVVPEVFGFSLEAQRLFLRWREFRRPLDPLNELLFLLVEYLLLALAKRFVGRITELSQCRAGVREWLLAVYTKI